METQTLRKFKWFWAWDDEKEEAWLGEMSRQGWHLSRLEAFGKYTFTRGAQQEYAYRMDFQTGAQKDHQEYLQLFADAGWEHVGLLGGWQYFRKPLQPGEPAEIFSDNQSKIAKYQRVIAILFIYMCVLVVVVTRDLPLRYGEVFVFIFNLLRFTILILFIVALLKLFQRVGKLKSRQ